jgi:hypothetical protein|tara:strand:+ start:456 stop:608 length:153 start_codon:yes stop_codon:yes gene_type:complete
MKKHYKKTNNNAFNKLLSLLVYKIKILFLKEKKIKEDIYFDVLNEEEFDY